MSAETIGLGSGKRIQDYIGETPSWPEGTRLQRVPMTAVQWCIWALAVASKFLRG
ncbi:hypothetical protein [Acidithiobacillus sp. AMEEHan]|uniref:hypothetical protein n=1 Tax=Acidithiobacillus sp. AMEEHan TaxID=2994951 RepID=UPI0027E3EA49|nr:hypothetical protein [Acidithiobacillus sp. AMEEHan]